MELRRDDLVRAAGGRDRGRAERLGGMEQEIRQAQAEALGRTGERLEEILNRLTELDRRLDALMSQQGGAERDPVRLDPLRALTEIRNGLRDEALRVRHQLIVQREALGLARQIPVKQCYPVPARRSPPGAPTDRRREP